MGAIPGMQVITSEALAGSGLQHVGQAHEEEAQGSIYIYMYVSMKHIKGE